MQVITFRNPISFRRAKTVRLSISGRALAFLETMESVGLSEREVFAKALYILEDVWESKRVCRLRPNVHESEDVEVIYAVKDDFHFEKERGDYGN